MNQQDLQQIGQLLDEKLGPITSDISTLKSDVSGLKSDVSELKKDMKDVKKNIDDLMETTAEILTNMVTKKEFDQLEKRVSTLENN